MSRYSDDGDYCEEFPNQAALWQANAERALNGKRGRQVLADLREALRNLPEKRLIGGAMCTVNPDARTRPDGPHMPDWSTLELRELVEEQGEGVCAVGAYLWWRKVKAGADPVEAFAALPTLTPNDGGLEETASLAKREADVVFSLAWELAYRNDEIYDGMAPEQRYEAFLQWLDAKLGDRETAEVH